jgi:hypothetical protein
MPAQACFGPTAVTESPSRAGLAREPSEAMIRFVFLLVCPTLLAASAAAKGWITDERLIKSTMQKVEVGPTPAQRCLATFCAHFLVFYFLLDTPLKTTASNPRHSRTRTQTHYVPMRRVVNFPWLSPPLRHRSWRFGFVPPWPFCPPSHCEQPKMATATAQPHLPTHSSIAHHDSQSLLSGLALQARAH